MPATSSAEVKLNALIQASQAILGKKSFEEAARAIFDLCCDVTGAAAGYVALLNETGDENEVLFLESGGSPCTVDPFLPMPIRGLRATAYTTHRAVYDNDFMNGRWVQYMPDGHVTLRNVLFAPLNVEGKTVGIMGLANKPADFTDDDAEIATVFGELAAIALSNSRYLEQLRDKNLSLERALAEVKRLSGLLPICSSCKNIRNDKGYWERLEGFIESRLDTQFSHSICPECAGKLYPELNITKSTENKD